MSEEERKEEVKKARISKTAMISVVVAVLGLLIVPFGSVRQYPAVLKEVFIIMAGMLGVIALIFAYVSLIRYPKSATVWVSLGILVYLAAILARIFFYSRRKFGIWEIVSVLSILFFLFSFVAAFVIVCTKYKIKGIRWKTVSSVTRATLPLAGAFLATICASSWLGLYIPRSLAFYRPCWSNLNQISMSLQIYANDYDNQYPEPNQWCDLLLKYSELKPESLVYPSLIIRCPYTGKIILYRPSPKKGRCHFAMNPNCKINSPSDTVLLFETDEGWNKFGGPDLLTTKRNKEEGCYVLLNNKGPQFIPKRRKLKWKADEAQEE
jgi:hypothetical protein